MEIRYNLVGLPIDSVVSIFLVYLAPTLTLSMLANED